MRRWLALLALLMLAVPSGARAQGVTDGILGLQTSGVLYCTVASGVCTPSSLNFCSGTAPTISSGFGTSPSVVANNGSCAFTINVGTGGSASSGVIGLPTATTGWAVLCQDVTTKSSTVFLTKQSAVSTTTATVTNYDAAGSAAAWVASDVLVCTAHAY